MLARIVWHYLIDGSIARRALCPGLSSVSRPIRQSFPFDQPVPHTLFSGQHRCYNHHVRYTATRLGYVCFECIGASVAPKICSLVARVFIFLGSLGFSIENAKGEGPGAISGHAIARGSGKHRDEIFLFGGATASNLASSSVFSYNMTTKTWKSIQRREEGPPELTGHSLHFYGDQLFVFGGFETSYHSKPPSKCLTKDMWAYTLATNRWRKIELAGCTIPPTAGHSSVLVSESNKILLFGGITSEGATSQSFLINLDTLEGRKLATDSREGPHPEPRYVLDLSSPQDSGSPTNSRFYCSLSALPSNVVVMVGGTDGKNYFGSEGVWVLNLDGPYWWPQTIQCPFGVEPICIAAHSASFVSDSLLIYGGLRAPAEDLRSLVLSAAKPKHLSAALSNKISASERFLAIQIST